MVDYFDLALKLYENGDPEEIHAEINEIINSIQWKIKDLQDEIGYVFQLSNYLYKIVDADKRRRGLSNVRDLRTNDDEPKRC